MGGTLLFISAGIGDGAGEIYDDHLQLLHQFFLKLGATDNKRIATLTLHGTPQVYCSTFEIIHLNSFYNDWVTKDLRRVPYNLEHIHKIIPKNLENYLTPLALSIWAVCEAKVFTELEGISMNVTQLNTSNFVLEDAYLLHNALKRQFGLSNIVRGTSETSSIFLLDDASFEFQTLVRTELLDFAKSLGIEISTPSGISFIYIYLNKNYKTI